MRTLSSLFCAGLLAVAFPSHAASPVIVHEWGTFTCLQDQDGKAIGGINVDDEPVPYFVHSVAIDTAPLYGSSRHYGSNLGLPPYESGKAWIAGDPQVTMRLETPVLYLYPPKGQTPQSVPPLDVHVDFHGGVLSQFYPHAHFAGLPLLNYPGHPEISGIYPYIDKATGLTEKTTTSLDWKGVQLGSTEKPMEIEDKVWTTPREVSAPVLQVKFSEKDGEGKLHEYTQAEHFLFYRGVGHLDSPLQLSRGKVRADGAGAYAVEIPGPVLKGKASAWMVEIRSDGSCAFAEDLAMPLPGEKAALVSPKNWNFQAIDFGADNLPKLKASMQAALIKEGLYPNEASAMLRTWELSYFKSPGLRFFYIVPNAWVDKVLPLKVNGAPTEITRVMVGRIELVTDAQKAILAKLSSGPCPDLAAVKKAALDALRNGNLPEDEVNAFYRGEKPLSELGIPIPPLVQDYLNLGRFRDALIVHEQQVHPSPALAQFIKDYQLVPQTN